mgnify:FL=1
MIVKKQNPSLRYILEPTNKRDENAVVVQTFLEGTWNQLGYIPGKKVPKVIIAIAKGDLLETTLIKMWDINIFTTWVNTNIFPLLN